MKVLLILCLLGISFAIPRKENFLSDEFIASINAKNSTWTAQRHFPKNFNVDVIKGLMGVKKSKSSIVPIVGDVETNLPVSFDTRQKWPYCKSMNVIRDQGCCGSDWALAAVEAISDRICIATKGKIQVEISVDRLLSCCDYCGWGCGGGDVEMAWDYWISWGLVTGGPYGSHQGCQPYQIPPSEHHVPGPRPQCTKIHPTPKCSHKCEPSYNSSCDHDRHYGKYDYLVFNNVEAIATEILQYGPVEAVFDVYSDFLHYKSGVYQHLQGELLGAHAVKILGWGVENGVDYWLAANSWNTDWGHNGFFRIRKGVDECSIEDDVYAGGSMT